jgi:hypothetical protein
MKENEYHYEKVNMITKAYIILRDVNWSFSQWN